MKEMTQFLLSYLGVGVVIGIIGYAGIFLNQAWKHINTPMQVNMEIQNCEGNKVTKTNEEEK